MKICAVSYLNTKPFLYGIEQQLNDWEIILQIPSLCVEHFKNRLSDIALIPVGSLLDFEEVHLIDNFCIGANGKVDSVFLFSQKPIQNLEKIYLDVHSRTSNGLIKILAKYHWNLDIQFPHTPAHQDSFQWIDDISGAIVIGDRAIQLKNQYPYVYDLAYEWKKWTGLPFVFAVWAFHYSQNVLEQLTELKQSFSLGIESIEEVATIWSNAFQTDRKQVLFYYQNNISYALDFPKKEALKLFLQYLSHLENQKMPIIKFW